MLGFCASDQVRAALLCQCGHIEPSVSLFFEQTQNQLSDITIHEYCVVTRFRAGTWVL